VTENLLSKNVKFGAKTHFEKGKAQLKF